MSTTIPHPWATGDDNYSRVNVSHTYSHIRLAVCHGPTLLTPGMARHLAATLASLADELDPEGAEPTPVGEPVEEPAQDRRAPTVLELIDYGGEGVPHITNAVRLNGHPLTLAASAPVHLSMRENRAVAVTLTIHPDELHLIKEPHPDRR